MSKPVKKNLWLACTSDEQEQIVYMADTAEDLDRMMGACIGYTRTYISRHKHGTPMDKKKSKYVLRKVVVDWNESERDRP